jgi:hypothetical protein
MAGGPAGGIWVSPAFERANFAGDIAAFINAH